MNNKECSKHGIRWNYNCEECELKCPENERGRWNDKYNYPQCEPEAASPDQIELGKLAAFGKSVWDWIKANPDFFGDEFSETFLPMAEESGLCRKEPYDPEKHGEIEYGETKFDILKWV